MRNVYKVSKHFQPFVCFTTCTKMQIFFFQSCKIICEMKELIKLHSATRIEHRLHDVYD